MARHDTRRPVLANLSPRFGSEMARCGRLAAFPTRPIQISVQQSQAVGSQRRTPPLIAGVYNTSVWLGHNRRKQPRASAIAPRGEPGQLQEFHQNDNEDARDPRRGAGFRPSWSGRRLLRPCCRACTDPIPPLTASGPERQNPESPPTSLGRWRRFRQTRCWLNSVGHEDTFSGSRLATTPAAVSPTDSRTG